jgi:hypothetical protein
MAEICHFNFQTSICEMFKNSIDFTRFTDEEKREWIGPNYNDVSFVAANDSTKTNIPKARAEFRDEQYRYMIDAIRNLKI